MDPDNQSRLDAKVQKPQKNEGQVEKEESATLPSDTQKDRHRLAGLTLAALGVCFGDIGTSPLYAIRECFHGEYGIAATSANILGVLSLIFWALTIIVSLKYLTFILRADNNGEGGVIALTALIRPEGNGKSGTRARWVMVGFGLFASSLLYGDGMITPAISVLSAVEGLRIITPRFEPYVIPATIAILTSLFLLQHHGTARVGALFGPVILCWFCVLAVLGFGELARHPQVLAAVWPGYALEFLVRNRLHGFLVLGAVFLVVTGAEALYADMGHFGKRPIRLAWAFIVLPALLINYFGQAALLLRRPEAADHPFFALVPSWAMIPMVALATVATIIASQAVITGAFSLTRQAIQLGYLPRLPIIHSSARHMGQIYVPQANWIIMLATIGLVLGFQSSSKLAAAYGVAVTSTMLIATVLFYVVARDKWGWSRPAAMVPTALFLMVDITFFGANVSKVSHGAWFPLVIGGAVFTLMMTWKKGREILAAQVRQRTMSFEAFQATLTPDGPERVNGQAVFLVGDPDVVPMALVNNLAHNRILHAQTAFLHFKTEDVPRVPNDEKVQVAKLGGGFFRIIARHGFMEDPRVHNMLSLARVQGADFKMEKVSFFMGRERLLIGETPAMRRWRAKLFVFMSRNAQEAALFYEIPAEQAMEVGIQLQL